MGKETSSSDARKCACGRVIVFFDYHWPHCEMNPKNLSGSDKAHMSKLFTKAELAQIATHGPVMDQPMRTRRGKVKV